MKNLTSLKESGFYHIEYTITKVACAKLCEFFFLRNR